jgi:hypothetical protein
MFPHFSDNDRLLLIALVVALLFGLFWWWNRAAKKWLEETGREEQSPSALDWLLRDVQQKPATPLRYSEQEFQDMVAKALDEFRKNLTRSGTTLRSPSVQIGPQTQIKSGWEYRKSIWYSELTRGLAERRDSRLRVVPDMSS